MGLEGDVRAAVVDDLLGGVGVAGDDERSRGNMILFEQGHTDVWEAHLAVIEREDDALCRKAVLPLDEGLHLGIRREVEIVFL